MWRMAVTGGQTARMVEIMCVDGFDESIIKDLVSFLSIDDVVGMNFSLS